MGLNGIEVVATGEYMAPIFEKTKLGAIVYVAVFLPLPDINEDINIASNVFPFSQTLNLDFSISSVILFDIQ